MLLAVEGGGFFSSSASGYSHGLALLLLGRKGEDKHDKASPCSHYRLVGQEAEHDCQVPSGKTDVPGTCASFICFGCTPARLVGTSPPKLSSCSTSGCSSEQPSSSTNETSTANGSIDGSGIKGCLKNNLQRDSSERSITSFSEEPRESLEEVQTLKSGMERRKVQWTDSCGKELFEIREFEVSDDGLSEDDQEKRGVQEMRVCDPVMFMCGKFLGHDVASWDLEALAVADLGGHLLQEPQLLRRVLIDSMVLMGFQLGDGLWACGRGPSTLFTPSADLPVWLEGRKRGRKHVHAFLSFLLHRSPPPNN